MKFRIAILGTGGVGGYFGGQLARTFAGSGEVEIIFIARGTNAEAIRDGGLLIKTAEGESVVHPDLVSDDPSAIGEVDLMIVATKAFDLEDGIGKYSAIIGPETAVLPLLNGVDHYDLIRNSLARSDVWNGCVFIVARLESPGTVWVGSDMRVLQFGGGIDRAKMMRFLEMLKSAGVDAYLSVDIERTVWEKYVFISPLASLTSYHDTNNGGLIRDQRDELRRMIAEVVGVGRAKGIAFKDDIIDTTVAKLEKAPPEATSSMHSDFTKGVRNELETLTGYVVREGRKLGLNLPEYERVYGELLSRNSN
jgi:2-dehydropantoate 2-reductase